MTERSQAVVGMLAACNGDGVKDCVTKGKQHPSHLAPGVEYHPSVLEWFWDCDHMVPEMICAAIGDRRLAAAHFEDFVWPDGDGVRCTPDGAGIIKTSISADGVPIEYLGCTDVVGARVEVVDDVEDCVAQGMGAWRQVGTFRIRANHGVILDPSRRDHERGTRFRVPLVGGVYSAEHFATEGDRLGIRVLLIRPFRAI